MTHLLSSFIFLLGFGLAFSAHAAEKFLQFAEVKSFNEGKSLPPQLNLNFDIHCNQRLVGVLRNDEIDRQSQITKIAVGILLEVDPKSHCGGVAQSQSVPAGPTFSGRAYQVILIKK